MEKLLRPKETAELLGVRKQTLYALARKGIVPSVRVGRMLRFPPEGVEAFIASGGKSYGDE
jgi:excisionase family DNA binding protein